MSVGSRLSLYDNPTYFYRNNYQGKILGTTDSLQYFNDGHQFPLTGVLVTLCVFYFWENYITLQQHAEHVCVL